MKIKTSELTGAALDWAVAKCMGLTNFDGLFAAWIPISNREHFYEKFEPSTNWSQGGPIIEREQIEVSPWNTEDADVPGYPYRAVDWRARTLRQVCYDFEGAFGKTALIAAMRCYVISKLGDEIDVPDELLNE